MLAPSCQVSTPQAQPHRGWPLVLDMQPAISVPRAAMLWRTVLRSTVSLGRHHVASRAERVGVGRIDVVLTVALEIVAPMVPRVAMPGSLAMRIPMPVAMRLTMPVPVPVPVPAAMFPMAVPITVVAIVASLSTSHCAAGAKRQQ